MSLKRRQALGLLATLALLAACKPKTEARCKNCGMKIDPASQWRAELIGPDGSIIPFDSPRCALTSWKTGKTPAKELHVLDYYDRQSKSGKDVRFVIGGDVVGPMGPDLVPVDPGRVSKFIQDHGADRALTEDEGHAGRPVFDRIEVRSRDRARANRQISSIAKLEHYK